FSFSLHDVLPPSLRSFPTRRSSDLCLLTPTGRDRTVRIGPDLSQDVAADLQRIDLQRSAAARFSAGQLGVVIGKALNGVPAQGRSEEHTSELQSRENLVCRLLLEKK